MKYLKQDLLVCLIGLLIFSSCQKSDLVGLDIDPTNLINSEIYNSKVNAYTVAEDSVITNGLAQHPFGYFNDPIFGTTESSLALGLTLPSDGFTFGSNAELDSAVLVLKYGNEFYGDSTRASKFAINVHQLSTKYLNQNYPSNKVWLHSTDVINENTIVEHFPWRDSSTYIYQIIDGKPDTATRVLPQLRIALKKNKINELLLNTSPSNFTTNTAFNNYIKGLYVTINQTQSSGTGGIIFFDLRSANASRLEVYYRNTSATDASIKDTNLVSFGITNNSAAASIKQTYSTAIKAQLANPSTLYDKIYVQPLAGLRAKIKFPDLATLKSLGKIAVNKAELVVTVTEGSETIFKAAPRLALYRTDIAGVRQAVTDNTYLPEQLFGGFYNSAARQYKFIITSYIQNLVNGKFKEYDTFLSPFDYALTGRANISASASTAARSVLEGSTSAANKIQLNIIYTRPN